MTRSPGEIQDWIAARVAALTGLEPAAVDPDAALSRHGLDSVAVVTLVSELEAWAGYRFRENPLDRHPTIRGVAGYLAERLAQNDPEKAPK